MRPFLRHRCDVFSVRITNDRGVETKDWAIRHTNLPCLLQEGTGRLVRDPHGQEVEVDGTLFIQARKIILPRRDGDRQDKIIITKPTNAAGVFLVQFVSDKSGLTDVARLGCLQCFVKRTRPEVPAL